MEKTLYQIGFTTVTFRDRSCEQICEIAKKNRIRYLEWGTDVHATSPEAAHTIRSLCEQNDITTVSLGSYYRIGDQNSSEFRKNCETAKILGASRIRVWLGRKSAADTSQEERALLLAETRSLADIAAEYDLNLAFEFHKKTFTDNADMAFRFLEECGKTNVRSYWQPFSYGNDEENLSKILPYADAVHVFSWNADNTRLPLSDKEADWRSFLHILDANGRAVDLILEFVKNDDEFQFASDIQTLRSWIRS